MTGKMVCAAALAWSGAAHGEWRATNPAVEAAAKDPRVAGALAAVTRMDRALVTGDKAAFVGAFADDARVNSPFNNIATKQMAADRFGAGILTYKSLRRSIEYAGPRRDDEVVVMGEETYEPQAPHPEAGKLLRRRFTDLWRLQGGAWKLTLRQATVFDRDPLPPPGANRSQ